MQYGAHGEDSQNKLKKKIDEQKKLPIRMKQKSTPFLFLNVFVSLRNCTFLQCFGSASGGTDPGLVPDPSPAPTQTNSKFFSYFFSVKCIKLINIFFFF